MSLFSPLPVLLLVCFEGVVVLTILEPLCSPLSIRQQGSVDSPCTHSITHSYLSLRGLLKECCWANGMMVLVIWKLPAVCVFHYWQWRSRKIYGSGKSLVNFFLFFRCPLCTNEVIESALYAVACISVGSGVLTGTSLWWYWCHRRQRHSCVQNTRKPVCFFLIMGLLSHILKMSE